MKRYIILTLTVILFCSCSTLNKAKNTVIQDKSIVKPTKPKEKNEFIKVADEKLNPEKQVLTPQAFTKWTIFTSAGSFLLFQFLKWKQIV